MQILILSKKTPYPVKDGENIVTMQTIKSLHELGHTVSVLTMNTSKHRFDYEKLPDEIKQRADFSVVNVDTEVKVFAAFKNLFTKESYNVVRFNSKEYEEKLIALLMENKFDIIQLEGSYLSQYLNTIRKFSTAKVVLRSHNIEFEIWQAMAKREKKNWQKKYLSLLARRMKRYELLWLNKHNALVPISAVDEKKLKNYGATIPSHVLNAGVEIKNYPLTVLENELPNSLFFLGSLDWQPNVNGVNWIIENVFPELKKLFPSLTFHIAGRNISDEIKRINVDGITIHGEVEDAKKFMLAHGIMLVPLFEGSGVRLKIVEGLAMGKLIVSTSVGAEGIDVKDGEEIFLADTKEDFIKKISLLLTDDALAVSMQNKARKFAEENFDTKKETEKLVGFYELLLTKHPSVH